MQIEAQEEAATARRVTARARQVHTFLEAIKFEHTVFALPFAYLGMVLAARGAHGWPGIGKIIWITLAMVGARTLAMGLNRLIDARFDALNVRTANRALPQRLLTPQQMLTFCVGAAVLLGI